MYKIYCLNNIFLKDNHQRGEDNLKYLPDKWNLIEQIGQSVTSGATQNSGEQPFEEKRHRQRLEKHCERHYQCRTNEEYQKRQVRQLSDFGVWAVEIPEEKRHQEKVHAHAKHRLPKSKE